MSSFHFSLFWQGCHSSAEFIVRVKPLWQILSHEKKFYNELICPRKVWKSLKCSEKYWKYLNISKHWKTIRKCHYRRCFWTCHPSNCCPSTFVFLCRMTLNLHLNWSFEGGGPGLQTGRLSKYLGDLWPDVSGPRGENMSANSRHLIESMLFLTDCEICFLKVKCGRSSLLALQSGAHIGVVDRPTQLICISDIYFWYLCQ